MKVVLADEALADLRQIQDHIALDDPDRASEIISKLLDCAEGLASFPERFPLVVRYESRGVRRRVWKSWLIFYRVSDEQVTVIHVVHGARDYEEILFPDG